MNLEKLFELKRKTKAGEVAPLVDVAIKNFWLWPGKAYWAYVRRAKIAIEQLELRKKHAISTDARVKNVVSLCKQLYDEANWPERGELFMYLMSEDSWSMVARLLEDDAVCIELFEKVEQQYGRLTREEAGKSVATVGELAAMLEKIASEGREKVMPRKRSLWLERVWWLWLILSALVLLWFVGFGIVKLVRWIVIIREV
ncbi:MAG: hypothetical protein IKJ89_11010 [Kiritimatiellae bacterium]|nr:hypothetical protein [Kiritimatiellia bacterium]